MSRETKILLKEAKKNLDEEKFQETISVCQQILSGDENCYNALVILGAALFGIGKLHDACQTLERATALDEKSPLAWQGLGKVYESEKMLSRLKRSKIADVYRKLCGFFCSNDADWLKLAKSKSLLARTFVFDFTEAELSKEDTSMCLERLKEAAVSLKDAWVLMNKHNVNPTEISPVFLIFIEQLRRICAVENGNVVYNECAIMLKDVYFKIFQLDMMEENNLEDGTNSWLALMQTFAPQDVATFVNECISLVVKCGISGNALETIIWRLIQINGTPKALLMYCQLMLEKSLTQPQIAKVRQLAADEHSVLKAEYQRQTGARVSSMSKFESDSLHLVFGCLAMFDGNKSRALEELTAISDPQHPIMFAYLARAYVDCGLPAEAVATALQGLKRCSAEAKKKAESSTLFSCFYDKRVISTELEALRVLALLECGTEPSYASLVQEIDDLISQESVIALGCETLAYVACRLFSSALTKKKPELTVQNILRKLELDMRYAISSGNPGEALEILDKSGVPGVENDIFLLTVESLACSYFNELETDKLSRGTSAATRALSISPQYALAHWTLGRCLYKIKQTSEAELHLAEACSAQPLNSSIAYDYCKILFSSQRHEECAAIVSRLVSVSSPCQWPYIRLALYHLEQKNANTAIHLLLAALRCPQTVSDAVEGTSLEVNSRKTDRLTILWRCLGAAYLQKGSLASAVRALNHCASLSASQKFDTTSASSLSEAYLRLGRTESVVKCLEEECEPTTNGAINIRKFIQIATAELQNAKSCSGQCPECVADKCLRVVEILFERTSRDQWNIALLWKLAGDASMLLADAVDHLPQTERPVLNAKVVSLLQLQSAPVEPNDWLVLASRFYSTAVRINPNLPQVWSDLSLAKARLNSPKCSIYLQLVSAQLFDCQSSWCNFGLICALLGKNAAAQHFFLSILPKAGQSPVLLVSMGLLYILTGKLNLAEDCLGYARKMIEAGCVETVTQPQVISALYMAEAALKLASQGNFKLKQLVDLAQLASSLPISAGFCGKLDVLGLLLRHSVLYFAKSTTVQIRNSKLNCKVFFEQLGQVIDNCLLLFYRRENDKNLQNLAGLCGHIVEMSPGGSIHWDRSARLFERAGHAFDWHKFRAKCLAGEPDLGEIPHEFGDRAYYLACLLGFQQKSPNFPEIVEKTGDIFGNDVDLSVAAGLAYALAGSYPSAKERLLKILIFLKQTGGGNDQLEARLLSILSKIAALTRDAQLHGVVTSISGQSLVSSNVFDLLQSENGRSLSKFVHQLPFRDETWLFTLRHGLLSGKMLPKFAQIAIAHVPAQDGSIWNALIKCPEDGKKRSARIAVHMKPYDRALWALMTDKKTDDAKNKIQSFSFENNASYSYSR